MSSEPEMLAVAAVEYSVDPRKRYILLVGYSVPSLLQELLDPGVIQEKATLSITSPMKNFSDYTY